MINQTITYSQESQNIVDNYNQLEPAEKTPDFWEQAQIMPIRAEVRNFYKPLQNHRCAYCNKHLPTNQGLVWDVEHVLSRATHPKFMFEPRNLCVACKDCNLAKGTTSILHRVIRNYPRSAGAFKIVHPHFDSLDEHIKIIGEIYYWPVTEKGAFTILTCNLYRFANQDLGYGNTLANSPNLLKSVDDLLKMDGSEITNVTISVLDEHERTITIDTILN